jgi:hypothetical protein
MPSNTHNYTRPSGNLPIENDSPDVNRNVNGDITATTTATGGGQAHNNLQPYITIRYCIKAHSGVTTVSTGATGPTGSTGSTGPTGATGGIGPLVAVTATNTSTPGNLSSGATGTLIVTADSGNYTQIGEGTILLLGDYDSNNPPGGYVEVIAVDTVPVPHQFTVFNNPRFGQTSVGWYFNTPVTLVGPQGPTGPTGPQGIPGTATNTGSTGPAGNSVTNTIGLNNLASDGIYDGPTTVTPWSFTYTGTGGNIMVTAQITGFVPTTGGVTSFEIRRNGITVATSNFFFNNLSTHNTLPTAYYIDTSGTTSPVTYSIFINSNLRVDTVDFASMLITEY